MKIINNVDYFPNFLNEEEILEIKSIINSVIKKAPLFIPIMPKTGKKFSTKMTNMGDFGWVSDKKDGYRYQSYHPVTGKKWPKIDEKILKIWQKITKCQVKPDCCLLNYYDLGAKMGLHKDDGEKDFSIPVLSISIGASALFRIGGKNRSDKTSSIRLNEGDILMLSKNSRLIYHGIDKIYKDSKHNHRFNLTLRKYE